MTLKRTAFGNPARQWMTLCRTAGVAALLIPATACSDSTPAPSSIQAIHGEVSDPAGDASPDPRVPVAPDLVHATADVSSGNITFIIQFAPGTFDRQATRVSVLLDTDQVGSTGIQQSSGIGADFGIDLAAGTNQATVTKADPAGCAAHLSCFVSVGTVPLTLSGDSMQVAIPLSLLGNDDGRLSFQTNSYVLVAPLTPVVFDFMPDTGVVQVQ
jgi:hypothetical protein